MKKTTFNVNFLLRRNKPFSNGEVPILVRITLNGNRAEFIAKHNAKPDNWNQNRNRAEGHSLYAKSLNSYLDRVYISLCDSMRDLEERGLEVSAENIKKNYLGLMGHNQITLLSMYEEHNKNMNALVGKGYSFSTLQKHFSTIGHLQSYLIDKYKTNDINVERVDNVFLTGFEFYLKSEKNISNNTTVKYLRNLGKIIRIALGAGYIKKDPFSNIKYHIEEVDRAFLDDNELHVLFDKKLGIKRLEQVKDVFLFCCFTGLAFIDAKTLTQESIFLASQGSFWIRKQRQKTKKWSHIPLMPQAQMILEKYKNHPVRTTGFLLPAPTNQKMNAYLKEIADLCGINKNLTTHCARHTFATTVTLANHVSMESVSKMLGHSSILMTKQYARILDKTVEAEMENIKELWK